ncbi:low temperature requirement protein A [Longimicrobium sp.]|uniref:low temperature requirement protein A n=1 Tax=Longimicrobium sp. TaxID=2029185 RepID=UPI002E34E0CF|nr:low temperature requirement protein A [Longimicrobium sp.]HEX6040140.1 low temperature requirement protein A [Longimicrobium sp.]
MIERARLLRTRVPHEHARVGFIELFFDLVFVFAVTQLSHTLIEHFTPQGALETAMLLLAVWWVWIYTSWFTNWLDPERLPVRLMMLGLTLAGLIVSASIPQAFDGRGLAFAGAYAAMQLGRTAFALWVFSGSDERHRRNFTRILAWLAMASVFWIGGGLAEGGMRIALWAAALAVEFAAPSLGYWMPVLGRSVTGDWNVEGGHFAERCGLFIIIALGESVLVTGATFSNMEWTAPAVAAFLCAAAGSLAMWWLYFDTSAVRATSRISHSDDPGRLARLAYTYMHIVLVAGIVLTAAGDEFSLAHPLGHASVPTVIAVLGGPAVFLVGAALFRWAICDEAPVSHLVGAAALGALSFAAPWMPPVGLSAAATVVLTAVAAWEKAFARAPVNHAEAALAGSRAA